MNEKDWEILKILYEEKSITKATNKLYLSQPALSYRLDRMEEEMNTPLFIKSTKGVIFTSAGERLVTYATRMLRQYSDIKESLNAREGVVSGSLRLGSSSAFAHNQLPLLLKDFHQEYPLIDILLHTGLSNEILQQMHKKEIHVAIIRGNHPWSEADILLQDESLSIVSSEQLTLNNLPNIPGIHYHTDPTMQSQITRWWQENFSLPPKILMNVDSVYTCRQLVMAGLGWAIMPALRLPDNFDGLFITEIRDNQDRLYKRPTRLIYTYTAKEFDATRVFIDFMCQKFSVTNI